MRAYATNSFGTAYGTERIFTTLPVTVPILTTEAISSITRYSAISGGNVVNNGGANAPTDFSNKKAFWPLWPLYKKGH